MNNNRLYNLNRWLQYNEGVEVILIFISTISFILMFKFMWLVFLCILSTSILFTFNGLKKIKFDKTKYNVPIIGETILVKKDINTMSYIGEYLLKGVEYKVHDVVEKEDDWIIFVHDDVINKLYNYRISYMQHKNDIETKSDIRNKKLDKLLK